MRTGTLLLGSLMVFSGCGDEGGTVIVTSPNTVAVVTDTNGATTAILFAGTDAFMPVTNGVVIAPEAAAQAAVAGIANYFPSGCATATASGNTVTYQLNNCRGPLGMAGLSGSYTLTYA